MHKASRYQLADFPLPKKVIVQIGLSRHLIFGRCKYCGKGPDFYYDIHTPIRWYDARRAHKEWSKYMKVIRRFCNDYYLVENPVDYFGIVSFTHVPRYNTYNARVHKNRNTDSVNDTIEFLICECGRSEWAFNEKHAKTRPEIRERKARYKYPHKFEDWI